MSDRFTYLDFNATAPAKPEVAEGMARVLLEGGNPSSVHTHGRAAKALVEEARSQVARLVKAEPNSVTFTGGGTESNNLVLTGAVAANGIDRILFSDTDHESVAMPAGASKLNVETLTCDQSGSIAPEHLRERLRASTDKTLVSIMLANNETGRIQDIAALAKVAHEEGALLHCDAVQAAGKIAIDSSELDVDFMTLSAHKFAGPQGVGALIRRASLDVTAQLLGGGQETGRRSGTENLAGIVGMGLACQLASDGLDQMRVIERWRDELEQKMKSHAPEAEIICQNVARLPNTTLVALPGVRAETQVMNLDLAGFGVSSGSACSSGRFQPHIPSQPWALHLR